VSVFLQNVQVNKRRLEGNSEVSNMPAKWLVTGAAGFIGSHLVEELLRRGQTVVGFDNLCAGSLRNLELVREAVGLVNWGGFKFVRGDIRNPEEVSSVTKGVDYVLHQAALGSVPRSIKEPREYQDVNVTGFLNVLMAARDSGVKRMIYASSSSVYGDDPNLPKVEDKVGQTLSPYAATKAMNELYAHVFGRCYQTETIGLRYFNVFGPRQNPKGDYAAVIPKWVAAMIQKDPVYINGDGETSRDFCFVENVVSANILAALTSNPQAINRCYNVAAGERTSLNQLFEWIRASLQPRFRHLEGFRPSYRDFREGDIRHSHADISRARELLNYQPLVRVERGLKLTVESFAA
jgi:UDP-N-acetylglucosamine/UDP-N-acetylgalactosamine 4-epimerase